MMMFLYSVLFPFYVLGICLAAPFSSKVRSLLAGHMNIFSVVRGKVEAGRKYLWFHASSLGEFEAGRPLLENLRQNHPEYGIILTFFSPSGYDVCKNYKFADIVCYMPFDFGFSIRRFLNLVPVSKAFFIKYEFWPKTMSILADRGIEAYSISAAFRKNQLFFRKAGRFYLDTLRRFNHIFVQDEVSGKLLEDAGISCVTVTGDTRVDRVIQIASQAADLPLVEKFVSGRKVCVVGSSWPEDESVYIPYFIGNPQWKLIIAPHVLSKQHLDGIRNMLGDAKCVFYSSATGTDVADADVLVIDCFGLLSSIYRYSDVAFIGGGYGEGIHNVLEAAVYAVPTMFGPNHGKFKEASDLISAGGAFEIADRNSFRLLMDKFLSDPNALEHAGSVSGDYVFSKAGTTGRICSCIGL